MELKPIKGSSQIHGIGYDAGTKTLRIQFHPPKDHITGPVYSYPGVTQEMHDAFMKSESKGKHFGANIKGKKEHPHTLVTPAKKKE